MRGGQRPAEEIAWSFRTALGQKECELPLRFNTLGNHALLEVLPHINYGAHDRRIIGIGWIRIRVWSYGILSQL